MLSNSRRRAPAPPPIHIPEVRHSRDGGEKLQIVTPAITPAPPTSPLSKAIPAVGPFPQSTTTLPTKQSTSLRPSSPTSQTAIVASTTRRLSTFTTTSNPRSPTRTSFVTITQTQTQSLFSPKDEGEKSPKDTSTILVSVSGALQFVTVTARPTGSTGTTLPLTGTTQNVTGGANLLPPGAIAPLVGLSVIAGVSTIFTIIVVLWRRRKKKLEKKAGDLKHAKLEGIDDGFRAIHETPPILSRRKI
ncbi:uncharacterized protein CC84DRAFT_1177724 [Paraphaeosphaeria sporulosa]|uniref:Uncharacterized protein n=1 Tax=Paraphaeosphaeria sporulosa TaxID=1460663 RepID=A0A177CAI6_9PLEO|nr:uncharacterized protein CC84DRAFT_1177724 [Paraphaeosphaeria sporulosa]OAG03777.1 hypothetical protein CC84DRAFT_1177724 [Paraphaeosphaeria sporulosa]